MNNKNYCCEQFRFFYEGENHMGLNIRIIKLNSDSKRVKDTPYRYVLTDGYVNFSSAKKMVINFCPFCGGKLNLIYNSESYINEFNNSI